MKNIISVFFLVVFSGLLPCRASAEPLWTWISGSNATYQVGIYGTKGVAAPGNMPGARESSVSWTDTSGNLWLFGGYVLESYVNDLWKFDGTNWTWVSGSNATNQVGIYGTKGVAALSNTPGAREASITWIDNSGNFWLFGGYGYAANSNIGRLNDLWKFDGTNWTWVSGSNTINQFGVYGMKGEVSSSNIPGGRFDAISWIDSNGNLWIFGGHGYAASGGVGYLNDLWKFDGTNWTWVSGSNSTYQYGVYGTKGMAASGNIPGARRDSVSWIDSSGNFWLFGGQGYAASGGVGYLNDLWKFDGTNWTWISGANATGQLGVYGIKGVADTNNMPGARYGSVSWTDTIGNFWLFSGYGYTSSSSVGYLNDLWRFDGADWTWIGGSNTTNQYGIYGAKGVPASSNVPGSRSRSVPWTDNSGNLWLFGGGGYATSGVGRLNDLWRFDLSTIVPNVVGLAQSAAESAITSANLVVGTISNFYSSTVPSGSVISQSPVGGSTVTVGSAVDIEVSLGPATTTVPDVVGMTQSAAESTIASASLAVGTVTHSYSDTVPSGSVISQSPVGGSTVTVGSAVNIEVSLGPSPATVPDVVGMAQLAAESAITSASLVIGTVTHSYSDAVPSGSVISQSPVGGSTVAIGSAVNIVVSLGPNPCRAMWTWISGSNTINQVGIYGTKGVAAPNNVPGARNGFVSWIDLNDNLWLFGGSGHIAYMNDLWKFDGANWTWVSGSNIGWEYGVYGTKGVAAPGNVPGARCWPVSWIDGSGNLWLFGGTGNGGGTSYGYLNDLWKFDGTNWTWVSGSSAGNQTGVYGTKGVAASDNMPGARMSSVSWTDNSGNLWLFGGIGYGDSAYGRLNDLWKFDGTNWTWVSGSNAVEQVGVYGTKGVAAPGNMPGARQRFVSWIDNSGNLWLFGGFGCAANDTGNLNDLWKFDGTNWTWVSGSNAIDQNGVYGTKGIATSNNVPGARRYSISWIDNSGNLWLFGGSGFAVNGYGRLNDLWKFDGTNWTWISGSNTINQNGVYGTKGLAASENTPGGRGDTVSWIDSGGNLWLFGGGGYSASSSGYLNDLWKFGIPEKAADINGDGIVNFVDFGILASQWIQSPGNPSADIAPAPAGDGIVNLLDLAEFSLHWLKGI